LVGKGVHLVLSRVDGLEVREYVGGEHDELASRPKDLAEEPVGIVWIDEVVNQDHDEDGATRVTYHVKAKHHHVPLGRWA
jgi:hypothetical protein